ncbi:MAG: HypC/HybG/HupF family hydrogenase formation chaperone [Candidatus Hydrothermarchaeota archaeon]
MGLLYLCLAIPGLVKEIRDNKALVDIGGVLREVDTSLLERVEPGDYVIVHVGYAIQILSKEEALDSLELWKELLETI